MVFGGLYRFMYNPYASHIACSINEGGCRVIDGARAGSAGCLYTCDDIIVSLIGKVSSQIKINQRKESQHFAVEFEKNVRTRIIA